MIHIADVSDLMMLQANPKYCCVLIHGINDNKLLDQLDPISSALAATIMHAVPSPRIKKWLTNNRFDCKCPMVIIFYPGTHPMVLYKPKLQEVVDYCTGRKFL